MSKYCAQCGNELNSDMVVCPKCGARQPKIKGTSMKTSKKNMAIIGAVALIVLLFILGVPGKIRDKRDIANCTKVVENFEKAAKTGDLKLLKKVYAPAFYKEALSDFSNERELAEAFAEEAEDWEEDFELQSLREVDVDNKYEELESYMEETDIKKVKRIYMATIKISQGEGYFSSSYTTEVPIVKIGSKWYWGECYF